MIFPLLLRIYYIREFYWVKIFLKTISIYNYINYCVTSKLFGYLIDKMWLEKIFKLIQNILINTIIKLDKLEISMYK